MSWYQALEVDMVAISKYLFIVSLLFFSLTASAQNTERDLAYELYLRFGYEEPIRQLPFIIHNGFFQFVNQNNQSLQIPHEVYLNIVELIEESFAAENIKEIIIEEIETKMSRDEMQKALNWLDLPLGKKCTQIEKETSTPETQAIIQKYVTYLQKFPPPPNFVKLIRELESTTKSTEAVVEIAMNTQLALMTAIIKSFPSVEQSTFSEIVKVIEESLPQLEAEAHQKVINSYFYAYRLLSDSELEQYIEFYKSNIGVKYIDSMHTGINKALINRSIILSHSIEDLFKNVE